MSGGEVGLVRGRGSLNERGGVSEWGRASQVEDREGEWLMQLRLVTHSCVVDK